MSCLNNARICYLLAVYRWRLLDLPRVLVGIARELRREVTR